MPLPDVVYLRPMLDGIQRLEEYAARVTRDHFVRDPHIHDGFVRRITVPGEAASKISKGFAASHPDIPWPDTKASATSLFMTISLWTSTWFGTLQQ